MSQSKLILMLSLTGCLGAPLAYAEDTTTEEDTVTVVDEGETPEDVTNLITLPDAASDVALEHAAFGQGVANQAREQASEMGREFGQQVSSDARALHEELASSQRGGDQSGEHGRP